MLAELNNGHVNHDEDLLEFASRLGHGEIHIKVDNSVGLKAIIAVHNTQLGPAIGGTRCIPYASTDHAIRDALRLSMMMSYKSAICGLPHGGGKSVIMLPRVIEDRTLFFKKFGEFVEQTGGQYIAAMDSGTQVSDMDAIHLATEHVTCTSSTGGDPSPLTALGVFRGLQACVKHQHHTDDLSGIHVAVQGVGHVGYHLCQLLHEYGAKLTVTDINQEAVQRCRNEFGANAVEADSIYDVDCDVYSPCALGGSLSCENIARLKATMIAGAANNQLAQMRVEEDLIKKGILYAPDFLINSGGIIHVAAIYDYQDAARGQTQINALYDRTLELFQRATKEKLSNNRMAMTMAEEALNV